MANQKTKKIGGMWEFFWELLTALLASRSFLKWSTVGGWTVFALALWALYHGSIKIPALSGDVRTTPTSADSTPFIEWHWWTVAKNTTLDQCVRMAKDVHEIRDGRGRHEVMARTGSVANYGDITGALFCLQEGTGPDAEVIAFVVAAGLDGSQAKSHAISLGELFRQKTGAR